jgi:hypothetical protein
MGHGHLEVRLPTTEGKGGFRKKEQGFFREQRHGGPLCFLKISHENEKKALINCQTITPTTQGKCGFRQQKRGLIREQGFKKRSGVF